jgi:ABC-2 type transport system permease protein
VRNLVSARRTLADLSVFGRGYVRARIGAFFSLIFPVILILLFGAIFSGGSSGPVSVYVQNQDGGQLSTQLVSALNGSALAHNGTWPITLVSVSPDKNFSSFLLAHSSSDGIIIPAGFTGAVLSGKHVNLTLYGNPASTSSAIV